MVAQYVSYKWFSLDINDDILCSLFYLFIFLLPCCQSISLVSPYGDSFSLVAFLSLTIVSPCSNCNYTVQLQSAGRALLGCFYQLHRWFVVLSCSISFSLFFFCLVSCYSHFDGVPLFHQWWYCMLRFGSWLLLSNQTRFTKDSLKTNTGPDVIAVKCLIMHAL